MRGSVCKALTLRLEHSGDQTENCAIRPFGFDMHCSIKMGQAFHAVERSVAASSLVTSLTVHPQCAPFTLGTGSHPAVSCVRMLVTGRELLMGRRKGKSND